MSRLRSSLASMLSWTAATRICRDSLARGRAPRLPTPRPGRGSGRPCSPRNRASGWTSPRGPPVAAAGLVWRRRDDLSAAALAAGRARRATETETATTETMQAETSPGAHRRRGEGSAPRASFSPRPRSSSARCCRTVRKSRGRCPGCGTCSASHAGTDSSRMSLLRFVRHARCYTRTHAHTGLVGRAACSCKEKRFLLRTSIGLLCFRLRKLSLNFSVFFFLFFCFVGLVSCFSLFFLVLSVFA